MAGSLASQQGTSKYEAPNGPHIVPPYRPTQKEIDLIKELQSDASRGAIDKTLAANAECIQLQKVWGMTLILNPKDRAYFTRLSQKYGVPLKF